MTSWARALAGVLFLSLLASEASAALLRRRRSNRGGSTIGLRHRLHVSSLITEPGTIEVEWNNSFDIDGSYAMPVLFKATPEGPNLLWGRTEFSAAVDGVSAAVIDERRTTHLSDHATFAATILLVDGEHWNVAVAPQASVWTRGSSGSRGGVSTILRYDRGLGSGGATLSWSGATRPSDGNPAGTWDLSPGYGRRLSGTGWASHVSLFSNGLVERSTGTSRVLAATEGIEVEFSDSVSLIVSGQQTRFGPGQMDYQIVTGLTVNLGHSRWLRRR